MLFVYMCRKEMTPGWNNKASPDVWSRRARRGSKVYKLTDSSVSPEYIVTRNCSVIEATLETVG